MPEGSARSGARLSEAGLRVLAAYRALQKGAEALNEGAAWATCRARFCPPRAHQAADAPNGAKQGRMLIWAAPLA
jgi:molybdate transport system regulatory protein